MRGRGQFQGYIFATPDDPEMESGARASDCSHLQTAGEIFWHKLLLLLNQDGLLLCESFKSLDFDFAFKNTHLQSCLQTDVNITSSLRILQCNLC